MTVRPSRPHIAIDPWGNLPYHHGRYVKKCGYDDVMRRECMRALYDFAELNVCDVLILPWKDTDFFTLCANGVPLYLQHFPTHESLWNTYSLVHFDAQHDVPSVLAEVEFFGTRTCNGGWWVFDDVQDYPHLPAVEPVVLGLGFERKDDPTRVNIRKASYQKIT